MSEGGIQGWLKILFGGLGVAAFTYAAPIAWEKLSHRSAGPDHVQAALRVEDGVFLLLVRNDSDDTLDLIGAEIEIDGVVQVAEDFGAYPEPSHVYQVDSQSGAELKQQDGRLFIKLRIAQALKPGDADQFGFKINGPAGTFIPPNGTLSGTVTDSKGNVYPVKY